MPSSRLCFLPESLALCPSRTGWEHAHLGFDPGTAEQECPPPPLVQNGNALPTTRTLHVVLVSSKWGSGHSPRTLRQAVNPSPLWRPMRWSPPREPQHSEPRPHPATWPLLQPRSMSHVRPRGLLMPLEDGSLRSKRAPSVAHGSQGPQHWSDHPLHSPHPENWPFSHVKPNKTLQTHFPKRLLPAPSAPMCSATPNTRPFPSHQLSPP